ncbi:MAG TPA: hypothetical protein ENF41_05055, partial [Candidatus Bathyarchaeota archaeon]|nr:hypothetical protein [Candidatus Bathyarchaeota archaeon]
MERASLTHEIMDLLKRKVKVTMKDGEEYVGNLIGISLETFTLCLGDVETSNGKKYYRILLNGEEVRSLAVEEAMIDLRKLAERLERVFPTMVKYNEEARVIVVMDRIRVGE